MELAGREVPIVWHGRRAKAFVPTLLSDRHLTPDSRTARATGGAAAEVGFAASGLEADDEPLARLLLRAEGVASSYIEGVRAPVADVVMAEEMPTSDPAAAWVAANLAALVAAVAQATTGELSVDQLCEWHRTLMTGSPTPARYVGVIRDEQGWIGGTDPTNATLVTPPSDTLGPLLEDLIAYSNRTDVDSIAQAAIAHAQFEIVHPFADGNGRIGRLLVSWILTRRLQLVVPPPVSVAMADDDVGYLSGLTLFRMGDHNEWMRWFAGAVAQGSQAQTSLIRAVGELQSQWHVRLADSGLKRGAGAWRVLDLLPRHLLLTSHVVAQECGLSAKGAIDALKTLARAGVLTDYGVRPEGPGRPHRIFVSQDLLALTSSSPLR